MPNFRREGRKLYRRGPFKGMIHIGADDVGRELVGEDNINRNNAIDKYVLEYTINTNNHYIQKRKI